MLNILNMEAFLREGSLDDWNSLFLAEIWLRESMVVLGKCEGSTRLEGERANTANSIGEADMISRSRKWRNYLVWETRYNPIIAGLLESSSHPNTGQAWPTVIVILRAKGLISWRRLRAWPIKSKKKIKNSGEHEKKKKKTCGLSLRTLVKEYLLSPKQQINEPTRVKLYS